MKIKEQTIISLDEVESISWLRVEQLLYSLHTTAKNSELIEDSGELYDKLTEFWKNYNIKEEDSIDD